MGIVKGRPVEGRLRSCLIETWPLTVIEAEVERRETRFSRAVHELACDHRERR
jgi:hypothetical protein